MHAMTALTNAMLRSGNLRRVTAVLCLALFLSLQVFVASRLLHAEICSDAAAPSHECPVTLLAQGQVSPPPAIPPLVIALIGIALGVPAVHLAALSRFDPVLIPTRGPPRR